MIVIGIFFILFGVFVILYPQFLAYMIGGLFLIIGINMILGVLLMRKKVSDVQKSWQVGGYEILKRRNK